MPEAMRCVLLCILEAMEGGLCLLEVSEVMRCVLLCMLDVLGVMPCAALYGGGRAG